MASTRKSTKPAAITLPALPEGVTRGWKFLYTDSDGSIHSEYDSSEWKIGEWRKVSNAFPIELCANGFHESPTINLAAGFVSGSLLALVECRGESRSDSSKSAHREMRIVATWTQEQWHAANTADVTTAHFAYKRDRVSPSYPPDEIQSTYYAASDAASNAFHAAVAPFDAVFAKSAEPINARYNAASLAVDEAYRKAKDTAMKAYYAACDAAETERTKAHAKLNSELDAALAPLHGVRDMLKIPAQAEYDAAMKAANDIRAQAVAEFQATVNDQNATHRDAYNAVAFPALGAPTATDSEYAASFGQS